MDYNKLKVPKHVAIIVDGNGRWALERGLSRSEGHRAGFENLKTLAQYVFSKGISILSIYVFSTENFKREQKEVQFLMDLFVKMFEKNNKYFMDNNIKVVVSGRDIPLPDKVIKSRDKLVEMTKNNSGGILNVCLNYGGRAEIVDAVKKIMGSGTDINDITEESFARYLYCDLPDVDLLIRTSGELRLSNFLLWQVSYAEFYFTKIKFPDFTTKDFDEAILDYTSRDRRFGGINNLKEDAKI